MTGAGLDWRDILLSYLCDTCGAGPGDPCITYTGKVKRETHAARYYLAHDSGWRFAERAPWLEDEKTDSPETDSRDL